jgi:hypothetical protein
MAMPETAVNKNNCHVFRQDYVRLSRQVSSVQAEPEAERVKKRAHPQLGLGVGSFDCRHIPAALLGTVNVGHVRRLRRGVPVL